MSPHRVAHARTKIGELPEVIGAAAASLAWVRAQTIAGVRELLAAGDPVPEAVIDAAKSAGEKLGHVDDEA